jgi:threonyl-tRNA synthetase
MVHRALLGSLERFFGVLTEHYGGAFPAWMAPVQAVAIPVAPAFLGYGEQIVRELAAIGVRAHLDRGDERMNAKIRNAQNQKVPYMLVLGEKEQAARAVSIRERGGAQRALVPLAEFLPWIEAEVRAPTLA